MSSVRFARSSWRNIIFLIYFWQCNCFNLVEKKAKKALNFTNRIYCWVKLRKSEMCFKKRGFPSIKPVCSLEKLDAQVETLQKLKKSSCIFFRTKPFLFESPTKVCQIAHDLEPLSERIETRQNANFAMRNDRKCHIIVSAWQHRVPILKLETHWKSKRSQIKLEQHQSEDLKLIPAPLFCSHGQ